MMNRLTNLERRVAELESSTAIHEEECKQGSVQQDGGLMKEDKTQVQPTPQTALPLGVVTLNKLYNRMSTRLLHM